MIVSPEQDVVYYPSGSDIVALYPLLKEREIITTLPFAPRCLTVAGEWLCCGGHHGDYTAISLSGKKSDFDLSFDPDARLPLDLDPIRRSAPRDTPSTSRRSRRHLYPLIAEVKRLGKETEEEKDAINNCITIWFPSNTITDRTYGQPVAVVANNDKSVYIVTLPDSDLIEKLTYPDCVNRAVMSPDGELLAAVLDDPFLYIHQRKLKSNSAADIHISREKYEWVGVCRIQLEGQTQADTTTMKGSFALCFSQSGKYLAVATQYGIISVFDVETITQEDTEPLAVFTSSRPGRQSGAVRDMEFSPGPFDLLAWTESSGRVGVADIRNLFLSRQLLLVDSRQEDIERITVTERHGEPLIDPRLRNVRTESPSSSSSTPDYLGLDLERRQLRHLTREMLNRQQSPLTTEELEILHAHRIARRQRDTVAEASRTTGWASWGLTGSQRNTASATNTGETSADSDQRLTTTGLPATLREFVSTDRTAASFRSFINDRNLDRERRLQSQEPRRRSSAILAAAERRMEEETQAALARIGTEGPGRPTSIPSRQGAESPNNPWAEIDTFYRNRDPTEPPADRTTRLRIELEEDVERQGFASRLRRPFVDLSLGADDESIILRGVYRRGNGGSSQAQETMGLSWSPDGRIL